MKSSEYCQRDCIQEMEINTHLSALFVTWNTIDPSRPNSRPRLRGCIGDFNAMPLADGLREYALIRYIRLLTLTMHHEI
jgi:AMMECR1 domain-containing protein